MRLEGRESRNDDDSRVERFRRRLIALQKRVGGDLSVRRGITMAETRLIRCPACGSTNRVPLEKVEQGLTPVCGRLQGGCPSS